MNPALRFFSEFRQIAKTLEARDFAFLLKETVLNAPAILKSRKLAPLDSRMCRDMTVRFGNSRLVMPLREIDGILSPLGDNPTFGGVREMYARNCYLKHLRLERPLHAVLDLGANRGLFSLLALVELDAEIAVGVEPDRRYDSVFQLLLDANQCTARRAPRYTKFISSPLSERANPDKNVSIQTICREQAVERFGLVKIDIEGGEKDVFSEPEWLRSTDNITMELHHWVGDLSLIPAALDQYGLTYRLMDQEGRKANILTAMFLVASRTGSLRE